MTSKKWPTGAVAEAVDVVRRRLRVAALDDLAAARAEGIVADHAVDHETVRARASRPRRVTGKGNSVHVVGLRLRRRPRPAPRRRLPPAAPPIRAAAIRHGSGACAALAGEQVPGRSAGGRGPPCRRPAAGLPARRRRRCWTRPAGRSAAPPSPAGTPAAGRQRRPTGRGKATAIQATLVYQFIAETLTASGRLCLVRLVRKLCGTRREARFASGLRDAKRLRQLLPSGLRTWIQALRAAPRGPLCLQSGQELSASPPRRSAGRSPRCTGRSGPGWPRSKRGTLKTGWCGRGRPFRNSMPNSADSDATRTITSKAIGMNTGQLFVRPAADVERIIDGHRPPLHEEARTAPRPGRRPARRRAPACAACPAPPPAPRPDRACRRP